MTNEIKEKVKAEIKREKCFSFKVMLEENDIINDLYENDEITYEEFDEIAEEVQNELCLGS